MNLNRLTLYSFRNYEKFDSAFVPGVNLIVGDNAQGKTNLLEAITYLSTGRSFRTRREQELIRFGDDFCDLQAEIALADRTRRSGRSCSRDGGSGSSSSAASSRKMLRACPA